MIEGIDAGHVRGWRDMKESLLVQGEGEGGLSFDVPGHPNDVGGWVWGGAAHEWGSYGMRL
jgi:hypothetical protein